MKRWVPAPECDKQTANSAILGIWLEPGERVEWSYTVMPDGKRVVTGYHILPILSPEDEEMLKNQ